MIEIKTIGVLLIGLFLGVLLGFVFGSVNVSNYEKRIEALQNQLNELNSKLSDREFKISNLMTQLKSKEDEISVYKDKIKESIAGPGTTWVANIPDEEAKILCLWFNSSFHLAQIFHERIEDIWLDIHKYILEDMLVLNPKALSLEEQNKLLKIFDEMSRIPFPSLERQYEDEFETKKKIDLAILRL